MHVRMLINCLLYNVIGNNVKKGLIFLFFSNRTAIRYHISNQLINRGWLRINNETNALFGDQNLSLNDSLSTHLEYKHLLAMLLKKHQVNVMPLSYHINEDNHSKVISEIIYQHYWREGQYHPNHADLRWILKPSTLNNGDQICLFKNIDDVIIHYKNKARLGGDHILQQYIDSPDLIDDKKYTFRLPVIVTNYDGVWVRRHGYVNISAVPFDPQEPFLLKKMHITNYVLDGELSYITQRPTWELSTFSDAYQQMVNIIQQTLLALCKTFPAYLRPSKTKRFEILGFDFMMDANKRVWLLEINQGPDAPMYEENQMKKIYWESFWHDLVEEFVLPISGNTARSANSEHFQQILTKEACYSRWRDFVRKLI